MKTKLFFLLLTTYFLLLTFCLSPCTAQVPQGFNYQAIARNANGLPITNQVIPVRISIVTALTGGTVIWQEDQSSVTADQFGMISLVVGTGTQTGGSAASFSAIDWSAQTLFLKTEVKYPGPGWTDMGTSQIWAVPYSLLAKNVAPLSKLGITGTTTDMEEALFEVKNQAGNTVFAVYNEGIRAYVGNGSAKGAKGGFSVGGYDATKGSSTIYDLFTLSTDSARIYVDSKPNLKGARGGFSVGGYDMTKGGVPVQNYLDVSNDSVRIYIDSNPLTKGKRGGFAVGGYDMTKGTNDNYLNVNTDATGIVNPVNRILWYPIKNAFLAGNIRIGTPDSVGVNSFATGYQSKSRGMYSQAMGFKAIANGDYSTAIGKNAVANNINSFAFGEGAFANNSESYAIGKGAVATGYRSFAFGSAGVDTLGNPTGVAKASGDYSFAIGQGSQASGKGSFAIGIANTASGDFSVALGYKTSASKYNSTAMGVGTSASGFYSTAMGADNTASGTISTAMGFMTLASGEYSTAMGFNTTASGQSSIAMGEQTTASGYLSTAMGWFTVANQNFATAMGDQAKAIGIISTAMGLATTASGSGATAMGGETTASGNWSTAMGYLTTAPSFCETAIGSWNTTYTPLSTTSWNPSDRLFVIGNGNSSSSNAVTVLKNGNVGIGTSTPTYKLYVNGNAYSTGGWSGSDIRWKKNIIPLTDVLDKLLNLNGVNYEWRKTEFPEINFDSGQQIGLIAQDVEKIFPALVRTDNNGYKAVSYEKLSVVLLEGMKEQQRQIESYKSKIEALQEKVGQIESQQKEIDELKALVNSLITSQTAQMNKE
jgi:hypothetical protein